MISFGQQSPVTEVKSLPEESFVEQVFMNGSVSEVTENLTCFVYHADIFLIVIRVLCFVGGNNSNGQ